MIGAWVIHGYAIVSADDRIAGADGGMPPELHNDADWARFQAAMDRSAVTVLGRLGHEQNPNALGRNRLVLSSSAHGVERRDDGLVVEPASRIRSGRRSPAAAPAGGEVVVVGGRPVFDLFLEIGFDEFHLTRAARVLIPGGVAVFSGILPAVRPRKSWPPIGLASAWRNRLDKDAESPWSSRCQRSVSVIRYPALEAQTADAILSDH